MSLDYIIIKLKDKLPAYPHMELNKEYIVPRGWLITKLDARSTTLVAENIDHLYRPLTIQELKKCKSARVLLSRMTGLGDQMWVSAIAHYLNSEFSKNISELSMGTEPKFKPAVDLVPNVKHASLPMAVEDFKQYDFHCVFFGLIDGIVKNERNVYEQFLEHIGVGAEKIVDEAFMKRYGRPHICIPQGRRIPNPFPRPTAFVQPIAVGTIRDLPLDRVIAIMHGLELRGYDVIVPMDPTETRSQQAANIIVNKLPGHGTWYKFSPEIGQQTGTLVELLPYLAHANLCLGTDSSFVHFAEGLGVPTLAIFGPFAADSRVKWYANTVAYDSNPGCRCAKHTEAYCALGVAPAPCLLFDSGEIMHALDDVLETIPKRVPAGESGLILL